MTSVTLTIDGDTSKSLKAISKRLRAQAQAESFDSEEGTALDRAAAFDKIVQLLGVEEKVAKRLTKNMTYNQMVELSEMDLAQLEEKATSCCIEIKQVKAQVEENQAYQEAKETLKTFNAQVRETCAPAKNTLEVCVLLAEQKRQTPQED